MPCARCQYHRTAIRGAIKSGSVKNTVAETASAIRTLNQKTLERLLPNKTK